LINNDINLKGLIRKLKETLSSIRENAVEKARKNYRNHLTNAGRAQNPRNWVLQWKTLYLTAKSYQVKKVEGSLAVTDFLVAIRRKMAPNWAHNLILFQNNKIVWDKKRKTLFEYEKALQRVIHSQSTYEA
jgi:CRISPR/Cas system Type II protein with McrA/HNH and RuvC-like nuclease domain